MRVPLPLETVARNPSCADLSGWKQTVKLRSRRRSPHDRRRSGRQGVPWMDLKPHASIAEFFHEVVTDAFKNQGVDASQPTEFYLVNLLATFAKGAPDDQPLAIKMASA